MRCKDYQKSIDTTGIKCELYHATRDALSVCKNGLKPRSSLINISGLGGGTDKLISFTSDLNLAFSLAQDIQTMILLAKGILTQENISEYLDKYDKTESLTKKPSKIWYETVDNFFRKPDESNLLQKAMFEIKGAKYLEEMKKNPIECTIILFSFRGRYLSLREEYGGKINPAFRNTAYRSFDRVDYSFIEEFSSLNPNNVGVIKVEGILPRVDKIKNLNSIIEIREYLHKTRNPNYELIKDPEDYNQMGVALFYPNSSEETNASFNVNIDKFKEIRLSNALFHKLEIIQVLDQEGGFFNDKMKG